MPDKQPPSPAAEDQKESTPTRTTSARSQKAPPTPPAPPPPIREQLLDLINGGGSQVVAPGTGGGTKPSKNGTAYGPPCKNAAAVLENFWRTKQTSASHPDGTSVAVSRPLQIGDLQSFILEEVPYGLTEIKNVQDRVKYDGPQLPDGINVPNKPERPPLYWYFDGQSYKISRALVLTYTYQLKDATGQYTTAPDSIYIGFEAGYDADGNYDAIGPEQPPIMRDQSYARAVAVPTTKQSGDQKLQEWLTDELKEMGITGFTSSQTGWVDYAGPARDAIATRPFPMSLIELLQNPDEFNKLLFWQVDGQSRRVAKAMRIQVVDDACRLRTILIGYQGAIGTGPG